MVIDGPPECYSAVFIYPLSLTRSAGEFNKPSDAPNRVILCDAWRIIEASLARVWVMGDHSPENVEID